jgi:hypothetical protein
MRRTVFRITLLALTLTTIAACAGEDGPGGFSTSGLLAPAPPEIPDAGVIDTSACDDTALELFDGPGLTGDLICLHSDGHANIDLSLATRGAGVCIPNRPCAHYNWARQIRSYRTGDQQVVFMTYDPASGSYQRETVAPGVTSDASWLAQHATWLEIYP